MYYIAFDTDKNKELLVYSPVKYKNNKYVASLTNYTSQVAPIGTLLMEIINTDFNDNDELKNFIYKYRFFSLIHLYFTHLNFVRKNLNGNVVKRFEADSLKLSKKELDEALNLICEIDRERNNFIYMQDSCLAMLGLDKKPCSDDNSKSKISNEIAVYLDSEIYELAGLDIAPYNFTYIFKTISLESIAAITFKELTRTKELIVHQCANCGKYFIPENLNNTKYCNSIFQNNKTCQEVGKDIAYKESLKQDLLLEKYRKRYMSLSSNVSHYGTVAAIAKFEEYKKTGAIMKKKYLNHKITPEEFESWIDGTKAK